MNTDNVTTKKCKQCLTFKTLNNYYKLPIAKDSLQYICKVCCSENSRNYRRTKNGLISVIYTSQKNSSKRRCQKYP